MTEKLLTFLRDHANRRGLVMVREEVLAVQLSATREELAIALEELAQAGRIRLLSPLPFLAIRLLSWSGHPRNPAVPYSRLLQSTIDSKSNSYRPQAVENSEDLLQEVLDTLGETDPTPFQAIFDHYPNGVIRRALDRVRHAGKIRKNRTALFRYLLVKLASNSHE